MVESMSGSMRRRLRSTWDSSAISSGRGGDDGPDEDDEFGAVALLGFVAEEIAENRDAAEEGDGPGMVPPTVLVMRPPRTMVALLGTETFVRR